MRRLSAVLALAALAACAPKEQATDSTAAAPAAAAIALSDVAGTWSLQIMPADRDTTVLTAELVASADPTAWTMTFPGRPAVPIRPTADGDSIMTEMGPYESALRKGVQVTTRGVMRLVNGELIGTTTGHYQGGGADSVAQFRTVGTKKM